MSTTTTLPPHPHDQISQRSKPGLLPTLPNISTTISSLLSTSSDPDQAQHSPSSEQQSSSLASYLPASVSAAPATMTAWFKKPAAAKSAMKTPRVVSRDSSPSKSVAFSTTSRGDSFSTEIDRRQSQETTSERGRKSRRSSKPKTSYSICYAPPRAGPRHKIQVRARPLLQLHKIESRTRPRPEYELLPSAIFSARLNKAIARFTDSKQGSHVTDLALVRAEKYHEHEAAPVEEDESMDILAIFTGIPKHGLADNKAKLCLGQGVEWDAYRLPNGGYECITMDAHGLKRTVRWVPKKPSKSADPNDENPTRRFKFSAISPNTRRHPVIANLSSAGLDIADSYAMPIPSTSGANSRAASPVERSESEPVIAREETMATTDEMRSLITATAVFVALCEGWCPGHRGEDGVNRSPSQKSFASLSNKRNMSLDRESLRRNGSMRQALRSPSFFRSNSHKHDSRPSSSASSVIMESNPITPIPEADAGAGATPVEESSPKRRARADTVGTVIMRDSGSQWRPSHDDETEDEAEFEPEGHDIQSEKGSAESIGRRQSDMTLLDNMAAGPKPKRALSTSTTNSRTSARSRSEPQKKLSTASTAVGVEASSNTILSEKLQKQEKPKRKSRLLRVLLCAH